MSALRVGRLREGGDLVLDFADAWHWALQGQTRSGKSVLTYGVLGQLAGRRDVVVAGLDPSAILLRPLAGAPHPEWRVMGTGDPQAYVKALQGVVDEMDRRLDMLTGDWFDQGYYADKIEHFSAELPLIVVVLEEYPGIIRACTAYDEASGVKKAEQTAPRVRLLIARLVAESAKVGVRVFAIAQRMSAAVMDTDARSQFGARISLRMDNGDGVRMLHEDVDPALLAQWPRFQKGVGVIDLAGERMMFRSDLTDYATYARAWLSHWPPHTSQA